MAAGHLDVFADAPLKAAHPSDAQHIPRSTNDASDRVCTEIGAKELHAAGLKDRIRADKLPAGRRALDDQVKSKVATGLDRITMRRNPSRYSTMGDDGEASDAEK